MKIKITVNRIGSWYKITKNNSSKTRESHKNARKLMAVKKLQKWWKSYLSKNKKFKLEIYRLNLHKIILIQNNVRRFLIKNSTFRRVIIPNFRAFKFLQKHIAF